MNVAHAVGPVDVAGVLPLLVGGGAVIALSAVWLALLTVAVIRLWNRDGEPVFRHLGDGRIRFTWYVAQVYAKARQEDAALARGHGRVTADTLLARGRDTVQSTTITNQRESSTWTPATSPRDRAPYAHVESPESDCTRRLR